MYLWSLKLDSKLCEATNLCPAFLGIFFSYDIGIWYVFSNYLITKGNHLKVN